MTQKKPRPLRRALRFLALLVVAAGIAAAGLLYIDYRAFADSPLAIDREQTIEVELGTPFARIVRSLRERGLTDAHPLKWRALAWEMGVMDGLHAGEYVVGHGLTPRRLLQRMARGDVIQHAFTIVEGWTFRELRAALAKVPSLTHDTAGLSDAELMAKIGAAGKHPEGRFLPETYKFPKGWTDTRLLERAHLALEATLAREWEGRDPDLPFKTAEEALVLASIVEKETGRADERPRIAGVFVRRLELGMLLQTDPTVIYGIGPSFDGNLTRVHLTTDTPYNTYTRAGLPPTPIALAGTAAIAAVMHPAPGNELYFVSRGDGSHEFTATLAEHSRAVARYQLRRGR
ncbi:MAG TPA: endolytic transglycosylase MltG [Xanthomonadales bacterium]|nr:endolytic transglycosylase MltG [Xanthomonadales bacterium]